ncbi:MAG: hypothetical protein M3256_09915 [Actinomycetota bacterium]|nr:hypothetical protein [Actinomycetota bacterium]
MGQLTSQFTGTASLTTTNRRAPGPFIQAVTLTAVLDAEQGTVTDVALAPIQTPAFPVKHPLLGQMAIVTTVSLRRAGLGRYVPMAGRITVDLDLHVAHRKAGTDKFVLGAGPSETTVALSTDAGVRSQPQGLLSADGSALDRPTGRATLVGGGLFRGGFLNGSELMIVVAGTFNPVP